MKQGYTTIPARFVMDYIYFRQYIWNRLYDGASTVATFKTKEDSRLLKEDLE